MSDPNPTPSDGDEATAHLDAYGGEAPERLAGIVAKELHRIRALNTGTGAAGRAGRLRRRDGEGRGDSL